MNDGVLQGLLSGLSDFGNYYADNRDRQRRKEKEDNERVEAERRKQEADAEEQRRKQQTYNTGTSYLKKIIQGGEDFQFTHYNTPMYAPYKPEQMYDMALSPEVKEAGLQNEALSYIQNREKTNRLAEENKKKEQRAKNIYSYLTQNRVDEKGKLIPFKQEEINQYTGELADLNPKLRRELDEIIQRSQKPKYRQGIVDKKTGEIYDQEYYTDYWTGKEVVTKPRTNVRKKETTNEYGFKVIDPGLKSQFNKDYYEYLDAVGAYNATENSGTYYDPVTKGYEPLTDEDKGDKLKELYLVSKYKKEQALSNVKNAMSMKALGLTQEIASSDPKAVGMQIIENFKEGIITEADLEYLRQWFRITYLTEIADAIR